MKNHSSFYRRGAFRAMVPSLLCVFVAVSCHPWQKRFRFCDGPYYDGHRHTRGDVLDVTVAGPVDPQWPTPGIEELEREFQAAATLDDLLRDKEEDPSLPLPDLREPLIEGDVPGVYVTEGHIGGFDYLEVVKGVVDDPDQPLPLVVMLHGRGGRPTVPDGYDGVEDALRIFIPRAPDRLEDGYTWLATYSRSPEQELFNESLLARTDQLAQAIAEFAQTRPTVGKPILMGFSQGGILCWTLAVRFPERYFAVFPTSAWVPPGLIPDAIPADVALPRIHALHGAVDKVVPTDYGRRTVEQMRALGWEVEWTEFGDVAHMVTTDMEHTMETLLADTLRANPLFIPVYEM